MTICGYNAEIADGLTLFVEGMTRAVEERAAATGVAVGEALALELVELAILEDGLAVRERDDADVRLLLKLNALARAFFELVEADIRQGRGGFAEQMRTRGRQFIEFIARTEETAARLRGEGLKAGSDTREIMGKLVADVLATERVG